MTDCVQPDWCDPGPWLDVCAAATTADVRGALFAQAPGIREFSMLLSEAARPLLEAMAQRGQALTRRHFGRTMSLYAPLYLSNYCSGGCAYCGFASDRRQPRQKLAPAEALREMRALHEKGLEDILLLTGERCPEADFEYVHDAVGSASRYFHNVAVESFAMRADEYCSLSAAGCTGITLYQETYDPAVYDQLHRWGDKRDYRGRIEAPDRALAAGMRTVGVGALLGLAEPVSEMICLYQHVAHLRQRYWRAGVLVSFPRIRHQQGEFVPRYAVSDSFLVQIVLAFRICFPDTPLVLSTREAPHFRDGMAGLGISRMSVASRTTVGGYSDSAERTAGQFDVEDTREVDEFCAMLRARGLEPVFKNWDSVFQSSPHEAIPAFPC